MAFDVDLWIDRRRLKRKLAFWRVFAVLAVVAAVIAGFGTYRQTWGAPYIARLSVDGIIMDDRKRDEALATLIKEKTAKALIVRIDSPGGTVVGGEALFGRLRDVAKEMPVVAVMGELGTSAAYMTAAACDHVIAHEGTITGSIGVIVQTAEVTALLEWLGIKPETIKSGPLKAQPNPLEPLTAEAREATQKLVLDMHAMFVDLVAERRQLARDKVMAMADGRVFTGRQALANGLVDRLGGENEARTWLHETHAIDRDLAVRDLEIVGPGEAFRDLVSRIAGKALFVERVTLDGVVSIWHPGL